MNLRKRFFLLVIGVIFIPILVLGVSYFIFRSYIVSTDPREIITEFNDSVEQIESIDEFRNLADNLEESYFGLMVETPDMIVSTNEDLIGDGYIPEEQPFHPKMILQSKIHTLGNGKTVLVILGFNMADFSAGIFPSILIITTLSVLIILSLVIIRSINHSIGKLEVATGKIAQGDLDFELDTRGSDKFGSLARSLDTMRHQIKMEYDRRNRFFMGISHDLKTPLASITGYTDALIEGMSDDKDTTDKYLGIIKNKSHQLEQRISHLIHYIKLTNSDFQDSLENKDLRPFLEEILQVLQEEMGFQNRSLLWSFKIPETLSIPFDDELLSRALENLIHNGFKYGLKEEAVTVSCSHNDQNLKINISNMGPAIPRDVLPYIFEPFYRGDKSRNSDGFGLGLASVKSIVESHGWSISVDSEEGKTTFSITIPLRSE